jgi:hypothetical protein
MPEMGLTGPFALTEVDINKEVSQVSPGVYALDQNHESGPFRVTYVGRSDANLNQRLHEHRPKYKRFQYTYFATAEEAFEKECALYHDFNPPARISHPSRPAGTKLRCPRCNSAG